MYARLALLGALLPAAAAADEVVLDRLAAVVGDEVITASEVAFEARLALLQAAPSGASAPLDARLQARVLDELIARALLFSEARRLRLFESTAKELAQIEARRNALVLALGAALPVAMAEFGVSAAELDALLRRRYYAERLITERLSGAPTEEEVSAYYQEHRDSFSKPLREIYDEVARLAQRELIKRRLVAYLDELRGRFLVRVLLSVPRE